MDDIIEITDHLNEHTSDRWLLVLLKIIVHESQD